MQVRVLETTPGLHKADVLVAQLRCPDTVDCGSFSLLFAGTIACRERNHYHHSCSTRSVWISWYRRTTSTVSWVKHLISVIYTRLPLPITAVKVSRASILSSSSRSSWWVISTTSTATER